jgi:transposase-like protein
MGRKSKYSPEFKAEVVEFYKSNSAPKTAKKFGVTERTIITWSINLGFIKGYSKYATDFKHEVCQYYDNHTWKETIAKFGITAPTLFEWRRTLGYRNKSRGYNLYTEGLQPVMQKRERKNFMMTRSENGDLKAELLEVKLQHAVLQREFVKLKETILEALQ